VKEAGMKRLGGAGHVARMEEKRNGYWVLVWKPEFQKPCGRPNRRCSDIRMDLRKTDLEAIDRNGVAQERERSGKSYILGEEMQ